MERHLGVEWPFEKRASLFSGSQVGRRGGILKEGKYGLLLSRGGPSHMFDGWRRVQKRLAFKRGLFLPRTSLRKPTSLKSFKDLLRRQIVEEQNNLLGDTAVDDSLVRSLLIFSTSFGIFLIHAVCRAPVCARVRARVLRRRFFVIVPKSRSQRPRPQQPNENGRRRWL